MHELRLFGADHVAVGIEHLFEECGARAWMAAEQRDTPRWLKLAEISAPAIQHRGWQSLLHFFGASLQVSERGGVQSRLRAQNCFRFQKRGHGLVVMALAVEDTGQFI